MVREDQHERSVKVPMAGASAIGSIWSCMAIVMVILQWGGMASDAEPLEDRASTALASQPADPLTGPEILERVREALKTAQSEGTVVTFLRKAIISDLKSNGKVRKQTVKTYRAYSDGRDQELIEVDGRPATAREIEKDRAHDLDRQQRYLHRQTEQKTEKKEAIMTKNIDLFRNKFHVRLKGEQVYQGRRTYHLHLVPKQEYKLEHALINRLMNAVESSVWVDAQDFRVARMQIGLTDSVSIFGGFAGLLRNIQIDVRQKPLQAGLWVDEQVSAFFDVRVFFKNYRFRMKSNTSDYEPVASEEGSTED